MIVSIATFTGESAEQLEEGTRHITQEVRPAMSGTDGLVAAYWLVDREKGRPVRRLELYSQDGRLLTSADTALKPRPAKRHRIASA